MSRHRLSLCPCTAPLSCSLQPLVKLSLFSLRPSLLQFVSIVSPHSPSLRFGLPAPQPSRRHHAQSLLGPSFHDPGTHHDLESHPEQAAPFSRRDDERYIASAVLRDCNMIELVHAKLTHTYAATRRLSGMHMGRASVMFSVFQFSRFVQAS